MLMAKKDKTGTNALGQTGVPTDGRVHATVFTISQTAVGDAWSRGNALDEKLIQLQDLGAEIISVMPYATGKDSLHAQAVIVFRAPKE